MPKELLLISRIQEKLRKLGNPFQKSKNKKLPKEGDSDFEISGANLLPKYKFAFTSSFGKELDLKTLSNYYKSSHFIPFVQVAIILLTTAFVVVSLLNVLINSKIKKQEVLQYEKVSQLENELKSLEDLTKISKKIELLKKYKEDRNMLAPYANLLVNSKGFNFKSFSLNSADASFSGTTPSPITFSLLVAEYLQSDLVDSVVLQSASLNTNENIYELQVSLKLK
mgnify:CR=1 FL=1